MNRERVPAPEVAPQSLMLCNLLLQPQPPELVYDRNLQPLEGVRWPRMGTRVARVRGEVALFEVTDPGELQDW